jgi:hypothetical protein
MNAVSITTKGNPSPFDTTVMKKKMGEDGAKK